MIKNRKVQLVYLAAACTVGIIGVLASMGLFEAEFRWDFYIYFTNISNYLCLGVMIAELLYVLRSKEDGYINALPMLKFVGLMGILLTFFIFNFILAPTKSAEYLLSIRSSSLHVLIPIIYVLDWFLFYERKKTTWKYPLAALVFPIVYLIFIFVHAAILRFDTSILCFAKDMPLIYPYFFLDYEELGAGGLFMWVAIISLTFLAMGYVFYFLDRVIFRRKKQKK